MIQLKIRHMDHKAILTVPAEYERVILALWTLGLDRDPEKYTLHQLGAEFSSTTEEEAHMIQLIDHRSTLMGALCILSEMVYPPYPVAERIHKKMAAGGYASEDDFFIEISKHTYGYYIDLTLNADNAGFEFPYSASVSGIMEKGGQEYLHLRIARKVDSLAESLSARGVSKAYISCHIYEDEDGIVQFYVYYG